MSRHLAAGIAAFVLFATLAAAAQTPVPEALEELDTVLVVGEQPGPGLWKVSRGGNVMWVLGTYGPLPRDMTWRASQVEARVRESQQVLLPGGVQIGADIGLLRGLTLLPAALKAGKIPEGRTLREVLDPASYARWQVLREKYIGRDDDIERWRPSIAIGTLRGKAMERSHLRGGPGVQKVVEKAAKKYQVPVRQLAAQKRTLKVEGARGMLKSAGKLDLPDIECFKQELDQLEPAIERLKSLANAWSRGNVEALRNLYRNEPVASECAEVMLTALAQGESTDAARLKKLMADAKWHAEQARVQAERDWLAAAREALERNRSTFAVIGVSDAVKPDGLLAKLQAMGYTVEDPS